MTPPESEANVAKSIEYHVRAFEQVSQSNRLFAAVSVGAVAFLIHEIDSMQHAPARTALLTLATLFFAAAAISFAFSFRLYPIILSQLAQVIEHWNEDRSQYGKELRTIGKSHDRLVLCATVFFIAALAFSAAFVVVHAFAVGRATAAK